MLQNTKDSIYDTHKQPQRLTTPDRSRGASSCVYVSECLSVSHSWAASTDNDNDDSTNKAVSNTLNRGKSPILMLLLLQTTMVLRIVGQQRSRCVVCCGGKRFGAGVSNFVHSSKSTHFST